MTTDAARINELQAEAQKLAVAAANRKPRGDTWGFYSYGDAPAAIGGGVGGFLWCRDESALLDFVGRLLPFFAPGPQSADWLAVAGRSEGVFKQLRDGLVDVPTAVAEANRVLKGFSQITWLGRFGELLDGEGEFARSLRGSFYEQDPPIAGSHRAMFLEFVRDYGL